MNAAAHNSELPSNRFDELIWGKLTEQEARAGSGSHALIPGWWAEAWLDRMLASPLPDHCNLWRTEDNAGKQPGGRKPPFSDAVTLTLSMLLVLEGQPLNATTVGHMLETRLSVDAREALGIPHLYTRADRDWYHIAYRALHRVIKLMDGWPAPKQLMLIDEREAIQNNRDETEVAVKRARGQMFASMLLDIVIGMQPAEHQRTSISVSVDQTSIRAGSQRRRWKRDKKTGKEIRRYHPTTGEELDRPILELEAGLYPKEKGAKVKDPSGADKFIASQWENVFVANILIDTREDPTADHSDAPPLLIRALSVATPNKRVGEDTLALLDSIQSRGYDITRLTFDMGYNHAMSGGFHKGLRERGIPNVQEYREEQKGITNGVGGAKFVEGEYYCPGTAAEHLDATVNYDKAKGDVSERHWRDNLAERWKFALHLKDVKPNGKIRLSCPALGPSATVACPIREAHSRAFRGKREPGQVLKKNLPKRWAETAVCCQDSITVDPNEFLTEQQKYRYGSDTWFEVYRTDRNVVESVNDKLKSDFRVDLNSERRMRGLAANQYVFTFKAAALNYKRIADYARAQLRKNDKAERRSNLTPIRPNIALPTPAAEPTDTKVRSRDRHGWSDYGRNRKKFRSVEVKPDITPED
ncbi:hypothetical protein [Curtobacterium flaccumfaciens]|uniref:hypothetical protein n=1 Tax=Curtobacterium flaccumfaciens TaxID=2035 RepID=UPI0039929293